MLRHSGIRGNAAPKPQLGIAGASFPHTADPHAVSGTTDDENRAAQNVC